MSVNPNTLPTPDSITEKDVLKQVRRYRLMQMCLVIALGLLASLSVARGVTYHIFSFGLGFLLIASILAYFHKVALSAYILLSSLSFMLFALSLTGAGIFDLALLAYPGLLIFAGVLGGLGLFIFILLLVIGQCVLITWLQISETISPNLPSLDWNHLLFILVIFTVTGFSVFKLVSDIKHLMLSLQKENAKVQQTQAEIQHLAHHDSLTNLPNRLYGEKLFSQALSYCESQQRKLGILFFDLDNFKPVNDVLGHAAGDLLLEQLAQRLSKVLKPNQHLIRFGGDEFILLAAIKRQSNELNQLAETIIKQCALEFSISHTRINISASLGIACAPKHGTNFKQLCRKADIAMYQAKQAGRNTYYYYDESLDKASDDKFKLLQLLRPAIKEQQFELYYQPLVNLADNNIQTVEALLRWPQADGEMIPPDKFIPLAESSGLINELGAWVIQQACLFCAEQRQQGISDLRVAVNVSVNQFIDGQLSQIVKIALEQANLPAQALELELTESLLINETSHIKSQLKTLSDLGVAIAIDDFGTGYSNLGYLHHFFASTLKIDRSFITALCNNKQNEPLVKAIIKMANSLGLKTVAEGIEDEATLAKLLSLGCDIGQGYYWSKPLTKSQAGQYLQAHNKPQQIT
ncbi:putative bifunctional diguanylate cyclase/phosphodiesterase [Paraglaciecola aestuariivivens]